MTRVKQALALALMLGGTCIFVGCGSPPADETKPVQAGDGTAKPTAAGASGAGGATAPAGSGKTAPN